MALVRKANVQYTVAEEMVKKYLEQGFDHIDEDGEIIEASEVFTAENAAEQIEEWRRKYTAQTRELEAAGMVNDKLKKEIKELEKALKANQ